MFRDPPVSAHFSLFDNFSYCQYSVSKQTLCGDKQAALWSRGGAGLQAGEKLLLTFNIHSVVPQVWRGGQV